MSEVLIYPAFFRYDPAGQFVFAQAMEAFETAKQNAIANSTPPYDFSIPITLTKIKELENEVREAGAYFNGQTFAPEFFRILYEKINKLKRMAKRYDELDKESSQLSSKIKEGPSRKKYSLVSDDYLSFQKKENDRLYNLAMKHRLTWSNGLNSYDLTSEMIEGTEFKCVICYMEFDLNPDAKKLWPKALKDYPVCSANCAIALASRAKDALSELDKCVDEDLSSQVSLTNERITSLKASMVKTLTFSLRQCATCSEVKYNANIDAYKSHHKRYGLSETTYANRCPECMGVFVHRKFRKKDFIKLAANKNSTTQSNEKKLGLIASVINGTIRFIGKAISFGIKMLIIALGIALSLYVSWQIIMFIA